MALVDSLLTAIVRADGDALVMHVGERPYVIASAGPIQLSSHALNLGAMEGMLGQLLAADSLRVLREFGAVEHELSGLDAMAGDRFTVVAARGGDDIWIEIRRHRRMKAAAGLPKTPPIAVPVEAIAQVEEAGVVGAQVAAADAMSEAVPVAEASAAEPSAESVPVEASAPEVSALDTASVETEVGSPGVAEPAFAVAPPPVAEATLPVAEAPPPVNASEEPVVEEPTVFEEPPVVEEPDADDPRHVAEPAEPDAAPAFAALSEPLPEPEPASETEPELEPASLSDVQPQYLPEPEPEPEPAAELEPVAVASALTPAAQVSAPPAAAPPAEEPRRDAAAVRPPSPPDSGTERLREDDAEPAFVVRLRAVTRPDSPQRLSPRAGALERLLRLAASRGASALYLTSQSVPAIRVDGEVQVLTGEPPLASSEVEAAVLGILPEGSSDTVRRGEAMEWLCDLPDVGRLRCTTFRDHRGPGIVLRILSARAASAEQLGLSREIQELANEPEGLVLIAGPRGSGKSTLVAAMVDLVNRQRADYVITLERQVRIVHENRQSLISQREVRGHTDELVAAARAARSENPDVLVIEDLRSPEALQVALDAAGSGMLVMASVTASSTSAAIEHLVDMMPPERRKPAQALLAETFRGAVSQVLLRKIGGGRVAARELLLGTSAVARLVAEGQLSQLPRTIDSGRRYGMASLNDGIVALVVSGAVDAREAYRKAGDRAGLLAQFRHEGIDTTFVERLA